MEEFVSSIRANPETDLYSGDSQLKRIVLPLDELSQKIKLGQLHLFPMEKFDEAVVTLNKLYPKEFADVSYSRSNVNKKKPSSISEHTKKEIEEITVFLFGPMIDDHLEWDARIML